MKHENYTDQLPDWLRDLQNESWQVEVVLSGLILFSLFQGFDFIDYIESRFIFEFSILNVQGLGAILKTANAWLIICFVAHLLLRAVWVGMVGLSYSFPQGIRKENLKYRPVFKQFLERIPDTKDRILQLERWASIMFSVAYLFFMSLLGALSYIMFLLVFPVFAIKPLFSNFDDYAYIAGWMNTVIINIGIAFIFDFLSLGLFKKIPYFARIYYPIYRVVNIVTLAFMYRNIYYTLVTNIKYWKLIGAVLVYIGASYFLMEAYTGNGISGIEMFPKSRSTEVVLELHEYDNLRDPEEHVVLSIQSDVIEDNYLRIFVASIHMIEDSIKVNCNYEERVKEEAQDTLALNCMKEYLDVWVDDSLQNTPTWLFYRQKNTNQLGVISYLNIDHLDIGNHYVEVKFMKPISDKFKGLGRIPFYKTVGRREGLRD